ncbi:hypothetical protein BT69DRAFT_1292478 [Atractiella rhizophila]|nr:hypothetical protein BT69DRAFT_1292478 [Atractiella rhizophila]
MFCCNPRRKKMQEGPAKEEGSFSSQERAVTDEQAIIKMEPSDNKATNLAPTSTVPVAYLAPSSIVTATSTAPSTTVTVHFRNLPETLRWQQEKDVQTLQVDQATVFDEDTWGKLLLGVLPQKDLKALENFRFYPFSQAPSKDFSTEISDRSNALSSFVRSYISTHSLRASSSSPHGSRNYSSSKLEGDMVKTSGGFNLTFHRTLRVPDDGKGLGSFPLQPIGKFASRVPQSMLKRGGYLMPIYQCEAMWMSFGRNYAESKDFAVKVSIGGVNAISGKPQDLDEGLQVESQDYIFHGRQPWLDGVRHADGVVRQFVAVPLGSGQTVEEQLTGEAKLGGIQIDVFPKSHERMLAKIWQTPKELEVKEGLKTSDLLKTLGDYKRRIGSEIWIDCRPAAPRHERISRANEMPVYIKTLTSQTFTIRICSWETIMDLKLKIRDVHGIPPDQQTTHLRRKATRRGKNAFSSKDYNIQKESTISLVLRLRGGWAPQPPMGFGVGGQIKQNIYEDRNNPRVYDQVSYDRVWIHTVSPAQWKVSFHSASQLHSVDKTFFRASLDWTLLRVLLHKPYTKRKTSHGSISTTTAPTLAPPYPDVQLIKPVRMVEDWNEERQTIEEFAIKNGDVITYHLAEDRVGALVRASSSKGAEADDIWSF